MTLIVVFHIFLNAASATLTVKKHKLVEKKAAKGLKPSALAVTLHW